MTTDSSDASSFLTGFAGPDGLRDAAATFREGSAAMGRERWIEVDPRFEVRPVGPLVGGPIDFGGQGGETPEEVEELRRNLLAMAPPGGPTRAEGMTVDEWYPAPPADAIDVSALPVGIQPGSLTCGQVWFAPRWLGWSDVVQYDGLNGPTYQCGSCYARTLTAAAPLNTAMSTPPRTPPPPGTRCCSCGGPLG